MDRTDSKVILEVVVEDDSPYILFYSNTDPYSIHYSSMDSDWKINDMGTYECQFLPKAIRSYKNTSLAVIHSGIAASLVDTSSLPETLEEECSIPFPFVVDDVCPSLFSNEFVYGSKEKCNLYCPKRKRIIRSVVLSKEEVLSSIPISIQSSAHPLIYYMSHPNGLYGCDFRTANSTSLSSKKGYTHLERIDGDWNHYIVTTDNEISIIDIRNPVACLLNWSYRGELNRVSCYQTKDSNAVDYHILSLYLISFPLSILLTARIQCTNHTELLGASFHRSYLDFSNETPTPILPSMNNSVMELLYYSPLTFDSCLIPPLTNPTSSRFDRVLGSVVTVGLKDNHSTQLETFTACINDSLNHIFCCDYDSREWKIPEREEDRKNQQYLHSLDIQSVLNENQDIPTGSEEDLNKLLDNGFFSQPKSIYTIQKELIARMNKTLSDELIEQWLVKHHFKSVMSSTDSISGKVWYDEEQFHELFNPFTSSLHPIDRKRIETLSDLWDKQ